MVVVTLCIRKHALRAPVEVVPLDLNGHSCGERVLGAGLRSEGPPLPSWARCLRAKCCGPIRDESQHIGLTGRHLPAIRSGRDSEIEKGILKGNMVCVVPLKCEIQKWCMWTSRVSQEIS